MFGPNITCKPANIIKLPDITNINDAFMFYFTKFQQGVTGGRIRCHILSRPSVTFKKKTKTSTATIAKLGKGENVTTDVLLKICESLDCDFTDIMELERDDVN